MTTFFDDIDDVASLKSAALDNDPISKARKAIARMKERQNRATNRIDIITPAAKSQALPGRSQALPSRTAPASTANTVSNEPTPYMEGWAAREKASELTVAPRLSAAVTRPAGSGALPSRNRKSIILVSPVDGTKLYLDKITGVAGLRCIDKYEYPTTAHIAFETGNVVGPYIERRLSDIWQDKHGLIKRRRNSLGEDGWELTPLGMDVIHGPNHGNPRVYKTSFEDNGNHNLIHRNNVTTVALKLSRGGSEGILYDINPEDTVAGLPIIATRTLHHAGMQVSANGNVEWRIKEQQNNLLNSSAHPYEANWYRAKSDAKVELDKAEKPLRLGGIPVENEVLEDLYSQRDTAFLFNAYVNGKYAPSLSVDFVTPRPKTGVVGMDGSIGDFRFNHDAHRVFMNSEMPEEMYQEIFKANLGSGMFGRFFAYADNNGVRDKIQDAWWKLFESGKIPPRFHGYRYGWLTLRHLPAVLNPGTNGAKSRIDG